MTALIAGVLPVFLMIALGYGLRKSGFLPDEAWRPIEKLSINIFYPSFLIPAIWHASWLKRKAIRRSSWTRKSGKKKKSFRQTFGRVISLPSPGWTAKRRK